MTSVSIAKRSGAECQSSIRRSQVVRYVGGTLVLKKRLDFPDEDVIFVGPTLVVRTFPDLEICDWSTSDVTGWAQAATLEGGVRWSAKIIVSLDSNLSRNS